jgi:hypothetical protein
MCFLNSKYVNGSSESFFVYLLNDKIRPISAGRDWPLYGDEYDCHYSLA